MFSLEIQPQARPGGGYQEKLATSVQTDIQSTNSHHRQHQ